MTAPPDPTHAFLERFDESPVAIGALYDWLIAVKDNICTRIGHTTAASRFLENYQSPFDATAVHRLLLAGATIAGKTNLDEFGMGASTEHSAFGPTLNPWNPEYVPGGSSGGSAAAVASGLARAALGSDTGGSIRQPAAHCGLVGLKPTWGRVSRFGLIAFASSLDVIGPIAHTVSDCAAILEVIAGIDPHDATSSDIAPPALLDTLDEPIPDLRIGVVRSMLNEHNHPAVNAATRAAIERLESNGATIIDIELPHAEYAVAAYYLIATAEASSNLARYDGVRFGCRAQLADDATLEDLYTKSRTQGFGPEVRRRIILGTHVLSAGYHDAYYLRALKTRRLIKNEYDRAFAEHGLHAILTPVTPGPPFRLGEKLDDPMALYLEDQYTVAPSLAGLPAISVPAGFTKDDLPLPVGVQLIAKAFDEATLLRVAQTLEVAWPERENSKPVLRVPD
jgi:aspartyl-tRNA(Asn)/glutamyl-tRNA(Gln) amidotransferase subunit A